MKKFIYILIASLVALCYEAHAQCSPDTSLTTPGIYPPPGSTVDSGVIVLPPGDVNDNYQEAIQIRVPEDTTITYQSFTFTAPIDSMWIHAVTGLVPGLSYSCDVSSCSWVGGANGCIELTGTPAYGGIFDFEVMTKAAVDLGSFGDTIADIPLNFRIEVEPVIGVSENIAFRQFELYPNPAGEFVEVNYELPGGGPIRLELLDLTGSKLLEEMAGGDDRKSHRIALGEFPAGMYLLRGTVDGTSITRKLIIAP